MTPAWATAVPVSAAIAMATSTKRGRFGRRGCAAVAVTVAVTVTGVATSRDINTSARHNFERPRGGRPPQPPSPPASMQSAERTRSQATASTPRTPAHCGRRRNLAGRLPGHPRSHVPARSLPALPRRRCWRILPVGVQTARPPSAAHARRSTCNRPARMPRMAVTASTPALASASSRGAAAAAPPPRGTRPLTSP